MTRDEMLKIRWKAYQEIEYKHPRMDNGVLCLLLQIDFDDESMTLQPLYGDEYICKDFIAGIQHCSIPKKKIEAAYVNGKKVTKPFQMYQGSLNRLNPYFSD